MSVIKIKSKLIDKFLLYFYQIIALIWERAIRRWRFRHELLFSIKSIEVRKISLLSANSSGLSVGRTHQKSLKGRGRMSDWMIKNHSDWNIWSYKIISFAIIVVVMLLNLQLSLFSLVLELICENYFQMRLTW